MSRELWHVADSRTGRRASIASYSSREQAERAIASWLERDAKGGRPDLHETIPFLVAVQT